MLSVIVPTYNERDNARALLERVLPVLRALDEPAELLIVDDDSPDGTAGAFTALAAEMGAAEQVRVVVRAQDRGLAKAVTQGFREARGDVVVVMDADLSHPPEVLPALLAPIRAGSADLTVASRRVPGGGIDDWPLSRRFTSWSAALLARPLVRVRDTTSGFFGVRSDLLEGVELEPIGYKIGLEVLVRTGAARVAEVPFVFTDRTAGKSKLGGGVILAYLAQLLGLYRLRFPGLTRYAQYALVGTAGALLDGLLFALLFHGPGLSRMDGGAFVAMALAFGGAVFFNFHANRRWTFRESAARARLGTYGAICVGGLAIRGALLHLLAPGLGHRLHPGTACASGWSAWAALAAALLAASLWNFSASRRWAFSGSRDAPGGGGARRWALRLVVGIFAFHLLFAGWIDLAADEAYYWQWSRPGHLAAGYWDHPPMVAWLIAGGTALAGVNEVGVRLATALLLAGLVALVVRITVAWARESGGPEAEPWRAALWAGGGLLAAPLVGVNGILATPDAPLLFFWTAAIALTLTALRTDRLWHWAAIGLPLGLGVLSKFHMGLLPPSLFLALLLSRRGRRALRGPGPYLGLLVGLAVCVPFARWMLEHDGGGLLFQFQHGVDRVDAAPDFSPLRSLGEFVVGQALFLTPILFAVVLFALWRARRGASAAPGDLAAAMRPLLLVPAVLPLALFAIASLGSSAEPNWPSVAYPTALVLAGPLLAGWHRAGGERRFRAWAAVGVAALVSLYAHLELAHPLLVRGGFFSKVEPRTPFGAWAHEARRAKGAAGLAAPVLGESYRTASLLAFYLPDRPLTGAPFEYDSGEQYRYWEDELPLRAGERAWFITRSENDPRVALLFREREHVGSYAGTRLGRVTRTWHAWWGTLRGEPIAREPIASPP